MVFRVPRDEPLRIGALDASRRKPLAADKLGADVLLTRPNLQTATIEPTSERPKLNRG